MAVFVLVVLGVLVAVAGVRAATVEQGPADLLLSLTIGCVVAMGCMTDARRRGRPLPSISAFAIFAVWPIAVPIYLLWSRGARKGSLLALAFVAAVFGTYVAAYWIAGYAVWGDDFLRA